MNDRCYRVGKDGGRAVERVHLSSCTNAKCKGCQPCTRAHCRVCGQAHAATVCTDCFATTRENLRHLVRLHDMLLVHAAMGGAGGHLLASQRELGGTSLVLAGPAASYDVHVRRKWIATALTRDEEAKADRRPAPMTISEYYEDDLDNDPEPIAYTLGTWEWMYRQVLDKPYPSTEEKGELRHILGSCGCPPRRNHCEHIATVCCIQCHSDTHCRTRRSLHGRRSLPGDDHADITRSYRFLNHFLGKLVDLASPRFEDLAHDLALRIRLIEEEMNAGDRDQTTALKCERCTGTYQRRYDSKTPCICKPKIHQWHGGGRDEYECPRCHHTIRIAVFNHRMKVDFLWHSPALPLDLLEERVSVPLNDLQGWLDDKLLKHQGLDSYGRPLYSVAEAQRLAHRTDWCGCPPQRDHINHAEPHRRLCCIQCRSDLTCRFGPQRAAPQTRQVVAS